MTMTLSGTTGIVTPAGVPINNAPAFSAAPSTAQSVTSGVYTKVNLGTENFDTNGNFASSRFTPTVAGYYFLSGAMYCFTVTTGGYIWAMVYKNGSFAIAGNLNYPITSSDGVGTVNGLVYMNGSTDYIEMYCYITGSTPSVQVNNTQFSGFLARAA